MTEETLEDVMEGKSVDDLKHDSIHYEDMTGKQKIELLSNILNYNVMTTAQYKKDIDTLLEELNKVSISAEGKDDVESLSTMERAISVVGTLNNAIEAFMRVLDEVNEKREFVHPSPFDALIFHLTAKKLEMREEFENQGK